MSEMEGCEGSMITPGDEHKKLFDRVGTWDVDGKFNMAPGSPPVETKATETVVAVGDFWVESDFRGEMFGMPFQGRSTMTYDPWAKQYISTWFDSMSPAFFHFTGNMEGDVLVCRGKAPNPGSGELADYRTTVKHIDPDTVVFNMYMGTPAGEVELFEMTYRRRK